MGLKVKSRKINSDGMTISKKLIKLYPQKNHLIFFLVLTIVLSYDLSWPECEMSFTDSHACILVL